jgi:hypothetical protein
VRASGVGIAQVVGVTARGETVVASEPLPQGEGSPVFIEFLLPNLQSTPYGTYFVRVLAQGGEVCMTGGEWVSADAPAHEDEDDGEGRHAPGRDPGELGGAETGLRRRRRARA